MTVGWIPDVVTDQVIAASWGNQIRDRTVTPFANAAARDAAIPAPVNGMLVYLNDVNQFQVRHSGAWRNIAADGPRGCIGSKTLTGNAGFNNSYYDISAGGIAVAVGTARRIHVHVNVGFYIAAANKGFGVRVERPGLVPIGGSVSARTVLDTCYFSFVVEDTPPAAGTYTYTVAATTEHNVDVPLTTNWHHAYYVYDMGPVTPVVTALPAPEPPDQQPQPKTEDVV